MAGMRLDQTAVPSKLCEGQYGCKNDVTPLRVGNGNSDLEAGISEGWKFK